MDVAIVGAGPIGLYLARQLKGLEVHVFEEHERVGLPVQCAGLISRNVEKLVKIPEECVLNRVKGAVWHSPGGKEVTFSRKEFQAYVLDRSIFDQSLAEGIDVKLGERITSLGLGSKYVVGADGPLSQVAKLAGFPRIEEAVVGVQYEVENDDWDTDYVHMYFGNEVAPGFFAWVIPTDERLRVGLAAEKEPIAYLDKFMREHFDDFEVLEKTAGAIPMHWRGKIVKGDVALVGDAAGQVKPTTGGGIYMGLRSAKILAEAIKAGDLAQYEENWKDTVMPELAMGLKLRNVLKKMPDKDMDKLFEITSSEKIKNIIEEHGDMDNPSALVKAMMGSGEVMKLLPYLKYLWS